MRKRPALLCPDCCAEDQFTLEIFKYKIHSSYPSPGFEPIQVEPSQLTKLNWTPQSDIFIVSVFFQVLYPHWFRINIRILDFFISKPQFFTEEMKMSFSEKILIF